MPVPMIHSLAQKSGKSDAEVEAKWEEAKKQVASEYPDIGKDNDRHWELVASITKKMVGLKETVMTNTNLKDLHPSAFHIDGEKKEAFYDKPDSFVKDATAAGANVTDHEDGVHTAHIDGTEIGRYHSSPVAGMANGYGKLSIPAGAAPSTSGNDDLMYMSAGDGAVASGPDSDALGMMGEATEAPASKGSDPKPEGIAANPAGLAPKDKESDEVEDRAEDAGGLAPHVHTSMESVDFLTLVNEEIAAVGDTAVVMQPFSHADYFEMIGDLTAADPTEVASSWNEASEQVAQTHPEVSPGSDEFQALVAMEVLGTFDDLNDSDEEDDDGGKVGTDVDNLDADAETPVTEAAPGAHLSAKERSKIAKKARKGKNIGHGGFNKVADKAAKEYGSKEAGRRVAAAAMWKNAHKESVDISEELIVEGMSKKHYVPIAAALKNSKEGNKNHAKMCHDMADIMQKDNPNFDRGRFLHAAGLNEGVYTKGAVGAVAGGAIGAAAGSAAGPAGTVAGGIVGAGYGAAVGVIADAIAALHKHEAAEKDPAKQAKIRAEIAKKQAHLTELKAKQSAHKQSQKNEGVVGAAVGATAGGLVAGPVGAVGGAAIGAAHGSGNSSNSNDEDEENNNANEAFAPKVDMSTPNPDGVAVDAAAEAPKLVALGNLPQYKNGALVLAPHVQEATDTLNAQMFSDARKVIDTYKSVKTKQQYKSARNLSINFFDKKYTPKQVPNSIKTDIENARVKTLQRLQSSERDIYSTNELAPHVQEGILSGGPSDEEIDAGKDETEEANEGVIHAYGAGFTGFATGFAGSAIQDRITKLQTKLSNSTDEGDKKVLRAEIAAAKAEHKHLIGKQMNREAVEAPAVTNSTPKPDDVADDASAEAPKDKKSGPAPEYKAGALKLAPAVTEAVSAKQRAKTAKIHDAIKRLTALRIQRVNAIKSHTPHADLTAAINVQKARIKALRA